ncbi:hypothetical protein EFP14_15835 [Lactiplantibacillus pentosus]|nr:hypothetical protein [Lactiplantibacillus pentosus]
MIKIGCGRINAIPALTIKGPDTNWCWDLFWTRSYLSLVRRQFGGLKLVLIITNVWIGRGEVEITLQ